MYNFGFVCWVWFTSDIWLSYYWEVFSKAYVLTLGNLIMIIDVHIPEHWVDP